MVKGKAERKKLEVEATKGKEKPEMDKLRCLSQEHCKSLQRGAKVRREEWMDVDEGGH